MEAIWVAVRAVMDDLDFIALTVEIAEVIWAADLTPSEPWQPRQIVL